MMLWSSSSLKFSYLSRMQIINFKRNCVQWILLHFMEFPLNRLDWLDLQQIPTLWSQISLHLRKTIRMQTKNCILIIFENYPACFFRLQMICLDNFAMEINQHCCCCFFHSSVCFCKFRYSGRKKEAAFANVFVHISTTMA